MSTTVIQPAPAWINFSGSLLRLLPYGRYRLMHWIGSYSRREFLMQMPSRFGGFSFKCNLQDTISREVCFTGQYEPQETALVRSILRSGMTFVDVGANWGYFTLLAANIVGNTGRVVSLEPDPRLFSALRENIVWSGLDLVTVLQVAAGNESGRLTLEGYDASGGNFGVSRIVMKATSGTCVYDVASDSLDNVLERQEIKSVDLMKMDIEGGEALALSGLENSLRNHTIKKLILELHPLQLAEHATTANKVVEPLKREGYKAFRIDHSPRTTRRIAYSRSFDIPSILSPLNDMDELDSWPHLLWVAPDVK